MKRSKPDCLSCDLFLSCLDKKKGIKYICGKYVPVELDALTQLSGLSDEKDEEVEREEEVADEEEGEREVDDEEEAGEEEEYDDKVATSVLIV